MMINDIHDKLAIIKTQLRRTPHRSAGISTYEMMFGRPVRTNLHALWDKPTTITSSITNYPGGPESSNQNDVSTGHK